MKEYFEKVNVKDELPAKQGNYITNIGEVSFPDGTLQSCDEHKSKLPIEWWLKPLTLISREKMTEVIEKFTDGFYDIDDMSINQYSLADAILNAGIPEKTVEIKKGAYHLAHNDAEFDCSNCEHQHIPSDANYCPNCGSKINWK